jgi:hypothetical protein
VERSYRNVGVVLERKLQHIVRGAYACCVEMEGHLRCGGVFFFAVCRTTSFGESFQRNVQRQWAVAPHDRGKQAPPLRSVGAKVAASRMLRTSPSTPNLVAWAR